MTTEKTELPAIPLEMETRALLKLKDAAKHLSIDYGALKVSIHRGTCPVEVIKIGRRSWVRTNDLRRLAGLATVPDAAGGAA
jgi:hypothetical protein